MLQVLYRKTNLAIKIGGITTDFITLKQGVTQGCSLSSTLYTMYMQKLIDELEKSGKGINLSNGIIVPVILYADDVLLLADNEEDFRALIKIYEKLCAEFRAAINAGKT